MNISARGTDLAFCISAVIHIMLKFTVKTGDKYTVRLLKVFSIYFFDISNLNFDLVLHKVIFNRIKMAEKKYYLIGFSKEKIVNLRKPPTLRMLLENLAFKYEESKKKSLRESVKVVIKNAMELWNACGIETIRFDHCVEKLEKEYYEWQHIYRNRRYETDEQNKIREAFKAKLDLVFDVTRKRIDKKSAGSSSNFPETESMKTDEIETSESLQLEQNISQSEKASVSEVIKKRQSGMERTAQEQNRLHLDTEYVESKYSSITILTTPL